MKMGTHRAGTWTRIVVVMASQALVGACETEPPAVIDTTEVSVPDTVRIALFNIKELSLAKLGDTSDLGVGRDEQLRAAAAIIQRTRPDVLVINEIDHAMSGASPVASAQAFAAAYLEQGEAPLTLQYSYAAPNNTGVASGLDLNGDGVVAGVEEEGTQAYGDDAFGFGTYPGQYSMAVLASTPIDAERARTFQRFRWKDLPGHHMPTEYYSTASEESLRLSSKSHWDLPLQLPGGPLHLLMSHPTPPVFDGEEDRNGRRNFDEVGFWARYLDDSPWLYDDRGVGGGYASNEPFVIAGDLNARPDATDGFYDGTPSIAQLLSHPRVQDTGPLLTSNGGLSGRTPGAPDFLERSTAVFGGGWRLDYLLPSTDVSVIDAGVFWPGDDDDPEGAALAAVASDHRLIWIDVVIN